MKCPKLGVDPGLSLAAGGITVDLAADHKPLIDSELVSDFGSALVVVGPNL